MSRSRWTHFLSIAVAACLLLAGCSGNRGAATDDAVAAPQDAAVQMADLAFAPASVTITRGSTITWTNNDSVPHTVSFGEGGPESSETIEVGETFEATFEEAGSYGYVCTLHPDMEGIVEVTDQAAAAGVDPNATEGTSAASAEAVATGAVAAGAQLLGAGTPGVDIAQGEWALVASAGEAPPGTITFRFRNLGTVPHALRIRTSGSGRDRIEWRAEAVGPGEVGLLVADLGVGTYDIDCPIEDGHGEHDQLGMEMRFTVHDGAALLSPLPGEVAGGSASSPPEAASTAVAIAAFAFEPSELRVPVGATVAWSNNDPTPHTVTGDTFDTGILEPGSTGTVTFDATGTFEYFCAIHPTMRGRVVIEP